MSQLPDHLKPKLPFLVAAFASLVLSVTLYFVLDERSAGIFVGLWVPSIHSLGALMLTPVADGLPTTTGGTRSGKEVRA